MLRRAAPPSLAFSRRRPPPAQPRGLPASQVASAAPDRGTDEISAAQKHDTLLAHTAATAARRLFDGTPRRAAVAWNAVVAGHARRGSVRDALDVAARMHRAGSPLTEATFASVFGACARGQRLCVGAQVHGQVIKSGCESFPIVGASLLDFYSSCFDMRATRGLFESLHQKNKLLWSPMVVALVRFGLLGEALDLLECMPAPRDVFAWTAVISGFAKGTAKCCSKALELFVRFLADGVMPNEYTYDSVLRACVRMGASDFGRLIHGCLIRSGFQSEQLITSALVDLYCSSDALDDALLVYNDLEVPSFYYIQYTDCWVYIYGKDRGCKAGFLADARA
ncbi:unnamed protein product [Urochloa humidicola]